MTHKGVEWVHWCTEAPSLPVHVYAEQCGLCGIQRPVKTDTCGCVDKELCKKTSMTREDFEEILGQPIMSWQWDRITTFKSNKEH